MAGSGILLAGMLKIRIWRYGWGQGHTGLRKRLRSSVNVLVPWTSLQIPDRVCYWFSVTCESGLQQVLLVVPPSATSKK
jgi:hypothetical protein